MNLGTIFSIKNKEMTTIITILGIKLKIGARKIFRKKFLPLPIENNKIVFSNFLGNGYGCNPKYIAEEIIRRKLPVDLVWLVNNIEKCRESFPEQIRLAPYKKEDSMYELATAKIWIDNNRKIFHWRRGLVKKEGQKYLQTWHGSLGIKKIDADVLAFNSSANQSWVSFAKKDSEMADYLLINSSFEQQVLVPGFWFENEVKLCGHARNDVFFRNNEETISKVRAFYQISANKKIMLYVPSFRDDKNLSCYGMEYKYLKETLEEKFGGEWIILVRLHPKIVKFQNILPQLDYVINATDYPDIQELLVTADAAITDYSSCIFDFMLSRKPAFIFATDIEKYNTDRGFYYPLEATPFPVAENNEQLRKNILNFDLHKYQAQVEEFLKEKGCMEDGHAAERIVDLIEKLMSGEAND